MKTEKKMESNLRICKVCKLLKQRIEAGKYNIKDKKYTDDNGKAWNGSTCNSCSLNRLKIHMRMKRNVTDETK